MGTFITEDFLLENETANRLFHEYAEPLPIIDYHCHLPPADIANNRNFENLTGIWLKNDHYKWRAMRALGIDEKFITGNANDRQKFLKWAQTVPYTLRNPLYHWTHLELKTYFGIEKLLTEETALKIYEVCSEKLRSPEFSARNLLKKMNVEVVCTTDDPTDSLEHHQKLKKDGFDIKILPAFRPDKAYAFDDPQIYNDYLKKLEEINGSTISGFDDLMSILQERIGFFHKHGCRLSDHALERLYFEPEAKKEVYSFFSEIRNGGLLNEYQKRSLTSAILLELGRMYHDKGWIQQYHLGALRNANERMMCKLGPDTGFDSIGDFPQAESLAKFLNQLDVTDQLTKTILYNVNSKDNEILATMAGNFNDGSTKGKMQFGTAWWFLDQKDGLEKQLNTLSNMGLLSCFIGMITDSRSFLSYPRHEYFRRVLCNLIGKDIEAGELPDDIEWTGKIVSDICYHNAKEYFNF